MTVTFLILICATILLAISVTSLYLLLKPSLNSKYKIVKISKTMTVSLVSDRITNGFKYAFLKRSPNFYQFLIGRRTEAIQCYQRPTSSRWFQCDSHVAIPVPVSNRLNGEVRRLEQWR